MKPVVSIGNQDFKSIIENGYFYIDKTDFIIEWWENRDIVTLITRPRRFGKTLNISMLEYFFSIKYAGNNIFKGLSIWNNKQYHELQGSYPVIFLSFANIKANTYENARMEIIHKLVMLYDNYSFLRTSGKLSDKGISYFDSVNSQMDDSAAVMTINHISYYLYLYYGKKLLFFWTNMTLRYRKHI